MQEENPPLAGRVAIVTGASRGIGRAIAERLAAAGATVVIGARSVRKPFGEFPGTAEEVVSVIRSRGGKALALALDVTDATSREDFIDAALSHSGRVDILINNGATSIYKKTDEMSLAEAVSQVQSYFVGPWDLCRRVLPHMRARGRGWIINLGSSTATSKYDQLRQRWGDDTLYAALKAAVHRFSLGLAAELAVHNIAVNVLAPVGAIRTPGLNALNVLGSHDVDITEPIEHIAEAALALLCHEPSALTGVVAFSHRYLDQIGRSTRTLDGAEEFCPRARTH